MSSSSEQGFLSSAATVRQESLLEGRKVEGAIPFEYGWSSGELHLNPACDVFIERCLTLLFFFLFSHHQKFKRQWCFVFREERNFETFGIKELHGVSLEGKGEGGRRVKRVQERRIKGCTLLCHFRGLKLKRELSAMRWNN